MSRIAWGALLVLVSVLSSAAPVESVSDCITLNTTNSTFTPAVNNGTLNIGLEVTLKGKWAGISNDYCRTALLWMDLLRQKGGIKATNGKVFGVHYDVIDVSVETSPGNGVLSVGGSKTPTYEGVKTLVNDHGSKVVFSAYSSTLSPYAAKAGDELGIPIIAAGAAAESAYVCPSACDNATHCNSKAFGCALPNSRRFDNMFGTFSPAGKYFREFVSLVGSIKGAKTIAFLLEDKSFTQAMVDGAVAQAGAIGMQTVSTVYVNADGGLDADPAVDSLSANAVPVNAKVTGKTWKSAARPFVERMKALDVDVIVGGTYASSCHGLVEALKEANWVPKAIGLGACMGATAMYTKFGQDMRWLTGPSQWDSRLKGAAYEETSYTVPNHFLGSDPPAPALFYDAFKSKFNGIPTYQGVSAMAGAYLVEGAVASAGDITPASIKSALSNYYAPSFWGINTADSFGKNERRSPVTWSYAVDGSLQVIAPIAGATTEFKYPLPPWDSNERNYPCPPGKHVVGTNKWNDDLAGFIANGNATWNATSCKPCPVGHYADENGMLACKPCPVNKFANVIGAASCQACPGGTTTRNATGSAECVECLAGTYMDDTKGECVPCPVGTAQRSNRSTSCLACNSEPGALYQDQKGQVNCNECPANTFKPLGKGGVSVNECLCSEGYWSPSGKEGVACIACPAGALCPASSVTERVVIPRPKPGYWAKAISSNEKAGPWKTDSNLHGGYNKLVAWFPSPANGAGGFDLPEIYLQCTTPDDCVGNNLTSQCVVEREGPLCSACRDGYFRAGVSCAECPDGKKSSMSVFVTVICWIAVITVWVTMNAIAASKYECLDVTLLFLQLISIVQNFSVPWPDDLKVVTQMFAVVNFDVDFVSPDCLFKWDHLTSVVFTFCLPIIWATALFGHYCLAWLWLKYVGTRSIALARMIPLSIFVISEEELSDLRIKANVSLTTLLIVLYNAVCVKVFSSFMCTETSDGEFFLTTAPSVRCGSSSHAALQAMSVIALLVYVIGVPCMLYWVLSSLHKANKLSDQHELKKWGFLYLCFEPDFWWWPLVYLARRLLMCLLVVFVADKPYIQVFIGVSVMIVFIGLQYWVRPFIMSEVDLLDSFAVVIVALYMLCGLVFLLQDVSETDVNGITVFLLFITATAIIFALAIVYRQVRRAVAAEKNSTHLSSFVANLWLGVTIVLREKYKTADELTKQIDRDGNNSLSYHELVESFEQLGLTKETSLLISEIMFLILDDDRSGELSATELAEGLYNMSDIRHSDLPVIVESVQKRMHGTELHGLLEKCKSNSSDSTKKLARSFTLGGKHGNSLRTESLESSRTGSSDKLSDQIRIRARVMSELERRTSEISANGGELTSTLDALQLSGWMNERSQTHPDLVMSAAIVDQWIAPHMADHGVYGAYSYEDRAIFYRRLVSGYPNALDFLLDATPEQVDAFRQTVDLLYDVRLRLGPKGHLAKLIVQQDRAPFLHWMVYESTEQQRSFMRKLMKDILGYVHGTPQENDDNDNNNTSQMEVDASPNEVLVSMPLED